MDEVPRRCAVDLTVLKTLEGSADRHGDGIARRIEQVAEGPSRSIRAPSIQRCCGSSKKVDQQRVGDERE